MRLILGFLIGLAIAGLIAMTALKVAWGDLTNLETRDRGDDKTMSIQAADFDAISLAGVFEVDIDVGGDYSVTLSGKEGDLDRTTALVENGQLTLDTAERDESGKRKLVKHGVTAKITLPSLSAIEAAGVVEGDVTGVAADSFKVDISGVGELDISGECVTLDADVSGVGELDAENLKCRTVMVDVSGVGSASVYASETVVAELAGIGKIEIAGSPTNVSKSQSSPFGRISVK